MSLRPLNRGVERKAEHGANPTRNQMSYRAMISNRGVVLLPTLGPRVITEIVSHDPFGPDNL